MDITTQLSVLVQLSLIDNQLSQSEKRMIYALGKANKIPEKDIDFLFEDALGKKVQELPPIHNLTEEDKFEYLYNLIQLMKVDKQVYLSEIRFCEEMAEKLGYKKQVVSDLSSKIFSDPRIITDRNILLAIVKKNKN